MAIIRATVTLNKRSGIPKDASKNVWHFSAVDTTDTTLNAIGAAMDAFYSAIETYWAPSVSNVANAHRVEFAEIGFGQTPSGAAKTSPILATYSFGTTGASEAFAALPNEAAIALSFRASVEGVPEEDGLERPRSRRRGRIFLGPFNQSALTAVSPAYEPQVLATTREAIMDAYDSAQAVWVAANTSVRHGVFSQEDQLLRIVEQVSVDDEWDTIRRRGQKPGYRMTRSITPAVAQTNRAGVDVALAS